MTFPNTGAGDDLSSGAFSRVDGDPGGGDSGSITRIAEAKVKRTAAAVAALTCVAVCAGCGGHPADYSTPQVIDALERSGVPLNEPIRSPTDNEPFDALLHAASVGHCPDGDAVSITVWRNQEDLRSYLERLGLQAAYDRWVTIPGGSGRAQRNVLAGLDSGTRCATRAQIDAALATLE